MIDLHLHLLPGVDDGPGSLREAVAMCRRAAEDGCTDLVATPHQRHEGWWNDDRDRLESLRDDLRAALEEDGEGATVPTVHLGGEIRVSEGLLDALNEPRNAGVCPLAGSRYLLLELSRFVPDPDPTGLVHELTVAGWRPILAHLEEIGWLADDLETVVRLVGLGATIQVTGASLTGGYGRSVRSRARKLLDAGLAHFLASDAHDLESRPPGLSAARAEVARRWGDAIATLLTETNPRAVLDDRPLPAPPSSTELP